MNIKSFDKLLKSRKITFKSDINSASKKSGLTRLIHAIEIGYPELVQLVIDANADLEEPGRFDKTPIMYAIEKKNVKICQLLIDSGANLNVIDENNLTIYDYALKCGVKILSNNK